jgi:hypothetical protein
VYFQKFAQSLSFLFVDLDRDDSSQAELVNGIKAAATCVLEHNAVIKSFENLGLRRLPIRLFGNDMQTYREGQYVYRSHSTFARVSC